MTVRGTQKTRDTVSPFDILRTDAATAAARLLGSLLEADIGGVSVRLKIVETEAYDQSDEASHSYRGNTRRTEVMFGPAGFLYVYFIYGMHYCCNVVVGEEGHGAAVLIRAVEPLDPIPAHVPRMDGRNVRMLTNGPAKLCRTLGITTAMDGHDLTLPPLRLRMMPELPEAGIARSARIGIQKAKDVPWRFYINHNPYVSPARV